MTALSNQLDSNGPDRLSIRGPVLWGELHRWALTTDRKVVSRWLTRFAARIGCGECRRHWEALVTQMPADLSSNAALFAWSVTMHNAINMRLGKPEMTVDAAQVRWKDRPPEVVPPVRRRTVNGQTTARIRTGCRGCGGKVATESASEGLRKI